MKSAQHLLTFFLMIGLGSLLAGNAVGMPLLTVLGAVLFFCFFGVIAMAAISASMRDK